MLKIRLQGTKNDIRWFLKLLGRDKRMDVKNTSKFFDNIGTTKHKRVYTEIYRKNGEKKEAPDKRFTVRDDANSSNYVGSGKIFN